MVASIVGTTTAFSTAGTQTPTVAVPSGVVNGDVLYALLSYSGDFTPAADTAGGWTEIAGGAFFNAGRWSLVKRSMSTGVTGHTWTIPFNAGGYSKMEAAMIAVRGSAAETLGTPVVRSASSSSLVLSQVTVPTSGLLLAFAADRVSSQTSVTAPTGMTERAKYINTGGGGGSVLIASQTPSSGASGTRTVTYGVASANAAGVLLALAAATGTPPVVSAGADAQVAVNTAKTLAGSQTGATSVAWTQVSGPTTTITNPTNVATASVTPTEAGVYVFRLTGTNTDGSTYDEMTLTVTATTVSATGVVVNPGNFTPVVAASIDDAVSDAADTTWAESSDAGASVTFSLAPVAARPGYTVKARMRYSTTPVSDVLVELLQGTTVVSSHTFSPTTSVADYTWALTGPEVAAITNTAALRLRITRL